MRLLLVLLLALVPLALPAQSTLDSTRAARIDAVFARYATDHTPGCAVAVKQEGRIVYEHGYGLASLELGVPITPRTVFDIGSVSKQFTAASLILLSLDGKLSLDDDVRRWLPELPDLGARVTLRHLLNHTSGWRDYTDLLSLAGWDERDHTTAEDAWEVLRRQRALNFRPGSTWRYSNTGYFLLGEVVRVASGKPLREFARERLFQPLGMSDTRYLDDTRLVVPRRASSYTPGDSGWVLAASDWEQVGDGAIQTTVEDLARWDANFDQPTVGGPRLLALLQERGRLAGGAPLTYAAGLTLDEYRGMARVQHGGAWVGFRAQLMRLPERRLAVLLTCNAADAATTTLAEGVIDAMLGDAMPATASVSEADTTASPAADAAQMAGLYVSDVVGSVLRVASRDGRLEISAGGGRARALVPLGGGRYRDPVTHAGWRFEPAARRVVVTPRFGLADTLAREQAVTSLPATQLAQYAGAYRSDDVGATYEVRVRGDHLVAHPRRGDDVPLRPIFTDAFASDGLPILPILRFVRDARGAVTALLVTTRGVHDLRFVRLDATHAR